jgi:hypothetical protein
MPNWVGALSGTVRARRFASTNPGGQLTYYAVPLQKAATDTLRPQVLALMLAAGFILLIACANIAGLTLVRMLQRTGEITIRLALGASRWQVQRQLWVEHLLLGKRSTNHVLTGNGYRATGPAE